MVLKQVCKYAFITHTVYCTCRLQDVDSCIVIFWQFNKFTCEKNTVITYVPWQLLDKFVLEFKDSCVVEAVLCSCNINSFLFPLYSNNCYLVNLSHFDDFQGERTNSFQSWAEIMKPYASFTFFYWSSMRHKGRAMTRLAFVLMREAMRDVYKTWNEMLKCIFILSSHSNQFTVWLTLWSSVPINQTWNCLYFQAITSLNANHVKR